jgi:RNase P/RNase MRP subunit p30
MKKILISENTFEKARKKIRENKDKEIIFTSNDDELNRKIMEKENIINILISQKSRKDFSKQRNSGLNQVMAKIAKKRKIIINIDFDEIVDSKDKEKSRIISRIIQNIKLCNKYKVKMIFLSKKYKRSTHEFRALGLVLGMPTWMTKNF